MFLIIVLSFIMFINLLKKNEMRKFIYFLGFVAASLSASAQSALIFSSSNITGLKAGNTHWNVSSNAGVKSPAMGSNQTWDYSGLKDSVSNTTNYVAASGFAATAVADTSTFENVIGSAYIKASAVYDVDASGMFLAGRTIPVQQYSEGFLTGNNKDSSYWTASTYKDRQNLIVFPETSGSSWSVKGYHRLTFGLSIAAFGLNKTPVAVAKHYYIKDTVIGWGTVNVPSANKSSIGYSALLVRRQTMVVDSFYVGTSPAPAVMLAAFGVKQNDTTITYNEYLYRAGTGTPMMSFTYPNNTYSKPNYVTYDGDNVQSSIENQGYDPAIFSIFPNPVSSGPVNIRVFKMSDKTWNLTLVNILGQTVAYHKIDGTGNQDIQLNLSGYKAGLYFAHVSDDQGNVLMSTKLELSR